MWKLKVSLGHYYSGVPPTMFLLRQVFSLTWGSAVRPGWLAGVLQATSWATFWILCDLVEHRSSCLHDKHLAKVSLALMITLSLEKYIHLKYQFIYELILLFIFKIMCLRNLFWVEEMVLDMKGRMMVSKEAGWDFFIWPSGYKDLMENSIVASNQVFHTYTSMHSYYSECYYSTNKKEMNLSDHWINFLEYICLFIEYISYGRRYFPSLRSYERPRLSQYNVDPISEAQVKSKNSRAYGLWWGYSLDVVNIQLSRKTFFIPLWYFFFS